MENLSKEITQPSLGTNTDADGPLTKKKIKKGTVPEAPKRVLSEGQLKALNAMNSARTKKKEDKLKIQYNKIMERDSEVAKAKLVDESIQDSSSDSSSGSSTEYEIITKPKRSTASIKKPVPPKTKSPPQLIGAPHKGGKKKTKIIIRQESSSESELEPEVESEPDEIIYKPRPMKTQQNRRSLIQQHNEKQITRNFFCN